MMTLSLVLDKCENTLDFIFDTGVKVADKVKVKCVGCDKQSQVVVRNLRAKVRANSRFQYRCHTCSLRGDGVGDDTPKVRDKVNIKCDGCGIVNRVLLQSLNYKLRSRRDYKYKCLTCSVRGDGVGDETPLGKDKISSKCVGCGVVKEISSRHLKSRKKRDSKYVYRCATCAIRGDGVGSETPLARDKIRIRCEGCQVVFEVISCNYKARNYLKKLYKCYICSRKGPSLGEVQLREFLSGLDKCENTLDFIFDTGVKVADKVKVKCVGCNCCNTVVVRNLRAKVRANSKFQYRCKTCNLRGDGVGDATPLSHSKVDSTCVGCGEVVQVRLDSLVGRKKSDPEFKYRCTTCNLRGDGVGDETPKTRDKVDVECVGCGVVNKVTVRSLSARLSLDSTYKYRCYTCSVRGDGVGDGSPKSFEKVDIKCVGCDKTHQILYPRMRRLEAAGTPYRCLTCSLRGDGVGEETPFGRDKVDLICVGCGVGSKVLMSNIRRRLRNHPGSDYKCQVCSIKGPSIGEVQLREFLSEKRVRKIQVKVGDRFGRLSILKEVSPTSHRHRKFKVCCDCGIEKEVLLFSLISGKTKSCGCLNREVQNRREVLPIGAKFHKLTILKEAYSKPKSPRRVDVLCDCGARKNISWRNIKRGMTKSCGCLHKDSHLKRRMEILPGTKFDRLTVVGEVLSSRDVRVFKTICDCGRSKFVRLSNLRNGGTTSCGCRHKSIEEGKLLSFVSEISITPTIANDRSVLDGKEIDIFIPSENLGVEYNGNYWHSEKFRKDKMYHFNKRLLAESKGVRLIQIREDEWLHKRPIVESLLKAVRHQSENRYFARKLTIEEVPGKQSQSFLEENHLMGEYRSARHLGLFTPEGQLVQLFSFKLLKDQTEMDCSRICSLRNHSIVGGVSRLLKAALRRHATVQRVISFVDLRYADGHSLEKIGFVREKVTLGWGWIDRFHWFNRLQCKADPKQGLTERENAALKGWYRLYDAGQAKYVKDTTSNLI